MNADQLNTATKYLQSVCPRPAGSAVAENRILPVKYDVEIIIPCYNVEKYVRRCIDSCLAQETQYRVKITAVNDGSVDRTGEILRDYTSRNNFFLIEQENRGHAGARNVALKELEAERVFFLDADDYLPEGALERMLSTAKRFDADVVEGRMINVYTDGRQIPSKDIAEQTQEILPSQLSGYVGGKLIRSSLFERVRFPEGFWFEDTIMPYLIYPQSRIAAYLPEDCYLYFRNEDGITSSATKSARSIETYWVTERVLSDMKTLSIATTPEIYDALLEQTALNYVRTEFLGDNVRVAAFYFTLSLLQELRESYSTTNRFLGILEKALRLEDYELYQKGCAIAWNSKLQGLR